MATRATRRGLDRWVTPGAQKMLLGMAVFGVLAFACWMPLARFSSSRNAGTPEVELSALQARAAQEQPVGGTEAETLAFLRSLGFKNQDIRIKRHADTGKLAEINGQLPPPERARSPERILAHCSFDQFARLQKCYIWYHRFMSPNTSPYFTETTPAPIPTTSGTPSTPGSR
jgi:hypothetical protein